ncbi:MAG: hypothetical protein HYZ57_13210 [Acidobacteria bacterium]|nr:hypothetical protein [Acidobacteriota bacterium]MBI3280790.1 hypothetical protein [Acidobacteriota bacterium]
MTAGDYVDEYHSIFVPDFVPWKGTGMKLWGMGILYAPVLEYSNILHTSYGGKSWTDRKEFKDHLAYSFFPKRAKESDSGISDASPVRLDCSWAPLVGFPLPAFQTGFGGKGTPGLLRQMIQLISYWRAYLVYIQGKTVASVPEIVSRYLGVDCNGFVGNYLARKFPGLGVDPNNPEETYRNKARYGGVIRTSPKELQADDIIIFEGHIAIIDSVSSRASDHAMCRVSESRSARVKNGGPQTNELRIELTAGKFSVPGHKAVLDIVRIPGMGP